jgi:enoyl-CoA hydratase/carnithine racemase
MDESIHAADVASLRHDTAMTGRGDPRSPHRTLTFEICEGLCTITLDRPSSNNAMNAAMGDRRLTAAEALDWGLITTVVPAKEIDARAAEIAARIATGPTRAYASVRRLLRQSFDVGLRDQLAAEQASIVGAARSADCAEGIAAFAEHRRPVFTGT